MNITINYDKKINGYFHEVYLKDEYIGLIDGTWNEGQERDCVILCELNFLNLVGEEKISSIFNSNLDSLRLPIDIIQFPSLDWVENDRSSFWFDYDDYTCTINLVPNYLSWNKPVTLLVLIERLKQVLIEYGLNPDFDRDLLEEGLFIKIPFNFDENLKVEYDRIAQMLDDEVNKIFINFGQAVFHNHLLNIFTFPTEIRQSCEQYLIYFCKFLEDLGVEASAKLDSQTKSTFFTIIPKNSDEALSNVKELLNVYLNLVDNPNLETLSSYGNDISVNQLISNIYHLKSQLMLANSIIQAKDAAIDSLKLTNYQQLMILETNQKKNEEKTLDGILTINEFEGKGFKINLPEIFRRLKRSIGK